MSGELRMSKKERQRMRVMERVKTKDLTLKEAAQLMGVSYRQARRIKARYLKRGASGLVHGGRGRISNRRIDAKLREQILRRYEERYLDFGPTFAMEKLREEGYAIHAETLRQWLLAAGLWQRQRRRNPYRQRRTPKQRFGELVQLDGSHHRWFEERGGTCCLMNMVDDATKTTYAILTEQESTEAAMRLLWGWIERYGIPMSLYCDRKSVYITDREPTLEEQLEGQEPLTAFGKACEKLGIEIITAYSPQAKGRVERSHGVYQDRLVKELRLREISRIPEANEVLAKGFVQGLNRRFSIPPIDPEDAHVRIPKTVDLHTIFCFESTRVVNNDWVVQYACRYFQLLKQKRIRVRPGAKVTVSEWLDGSIHILYQKRELDNLEITRQVLERARKRAS